MQLLRWRLWARAPPPPPLPRQVDYRAQRLALAVGPNGQEPTRNMGSLSGGERSISSLAFILALGKEVAPPFNAFDEFDVRRALRPPPAGCQRVATLYTPCRSV